MLHWRSELKRLAIAVVRNPYQFCIVDNVLAFYFQYFVNIKQGYGFFYLRHLGRGKKEAVRLLKLLERREPMHVDLLPNVTIIGDA